MNILIFAVGEKALGVITAINHFYPNINISCVAGTDSGMIDDFYDSIRIFCQKNGISFFNKENFSYKPQEFSLILCIGWRWLIESFDKNVCPVVLHDSLLPKYRGFAPLVSALLNKEKFVGVSAIYASKEYDNGALILQKSIPVNYPTSIYSEIKRVQQLYIDISLELVECLIKDNFPPPKTQDESVATYSLWRGEDDYRIDWSNSSNEIEHFINCLGYPYKGASTMMGEELVRIQSAKSVPDVKIENRAPGKVIFMSQGIPIVVCGTGLLKINSITLNNANLIPLPKFRIHFK